LRLHSVEKIGGALRIRGGLENRAFVGFQQIKPVREIARLARGIEAVRPRRGNASRLREPGRRKADAPTVRN